MKSPADLLNVDTFETERVFFKYKSFYVRPSGTTLLTKEAYEVLLIWAADTQAGIEAGGDSSAFANVEFTLLGQNSAVASRPSDATAYPYRDAIFVVQYGIEWEDGTKSKKYLAYIDALETKLNSFIQANPPAYINYVDSQVSLESFYGPNYDRLKQIKTAVDPGNYFQNPMTIPSSAQPSSSPGGSPSPATPETNSAGAAHRCNVIGVILSVFIALAVNMLIM